MEQGIETTAWELLDDLAISSGYLKELIEQLESDFSAADGGYRQLHALVDPIQRAVVSDQICMSASAVRSNLVEARLHEQRLSQIVGDSGVPFPAEETYGEDLRRNAERDMEIIGCTRAMGSALDCLGAVAVGIMRMPRAITQASFLDIERVATGKVVAAATTDQQRAWKGLHELCKAHREKPPDGWSEWLMDMRNLNVHRARQTHIQLQRIRDKHQPQAVVVTSEPEEMLKMTARFDLHLRRRPNLPDMLDFISSPSTTDLWIDEPATTTLAGMFIAVNELVEEAAQLLASWWRYARKWPDVFPPPAAKWALQSPPWPSFGGVAPRATPFPIGKSHVGPLQHERLALAEKLRKH
jgi:hypothetical protein